MTMNALSASAMTRIPKIISPIAGPATRVVQRWPDTSLDGVIVRLIHDDVDLSVQDHKVSMKIATCPERQADRLASPSTTGRN
ncbi:hypothetical protein HDA40_002017 [Hamadaea flava]|uniref:Uncharacterized protein n=1 Tax=Hamadaea flava TaxID=1742688 RepID=A0ABV8LZV8_9ACTN|nr:hypothetical protein [Hamadaea flava]MCP2323510.1 hypothetical protein [Hamadaea flava]